jgi:hypothetical protein
MESEMQEVPMKSTWMGEDIDTLPREKLIEIIHHLGRDLDAARAATRSVIEMGELVRKARQRL